MIDALIIGYNDVEFSEYVENVRRMGEKSGAFKDLDLAFLQYEGKPYRALDLLTKFFYERKDIAPRPFHNCDFLWPTITYLGSYLTARGFTFDYINLYQSEKEILKQKLMRADIRTIAITTTLYVTPQPIIEMISFIRQYNTTAMIVVGGPFVANQTATQDAHTLETIFHYIGADCYVDSNEGEATFAQILTALKKEQSLDQVDNIAYRQSNQFIFTKKTLETNALNDNPINYRLFSDGAIGEFVSLRTAKSCPFTCAFCGFPKRAGAYQYLPVEEVERELDALAELGTVTTVTFLDDTFNVPKGRFKGILRMMIRKQYPFKWNSFYRSDHGDEEAIALMAEAGCEGVFLGVESGSDTMLKKMNKTVRRKDYLKTIPLFRQHGIATYASLIIGYPGETYETVQETIELIETTKPDFFRAQLWYADPLTPVWQQRDELGIKGEAFNWSHHTMDCQTACDLIDKMFLGIEHSIWMPQNGFEQWSTFYLQRRGMSLEQVKSFITCFNDGVKEKLLYPERREASAAVISRIRQCSQYDRPQSFPLPAASLFPAIEYNAAESFFLSEIAQGNPQSNLAVLSNTTKGYGEPFSSVKCDVDIDVLDRFARSDRSRWSQVLLTTFSLLLSRLNGYQDTTMIVSEDSGKGSAFVTPVRLYPVGAKIFNNFVAEVGHQVEQAQSHARYAFHFLTNGQRLKQYGLTQPQLNVAYCFHHQSNHEISNGLELLREHSPQVADRLVLLLDVQRGKYGLAVYFRYATACLDRASVEDLAVYFLMLLRDAAANPHERLDALATSDGVSRQSATETRATMDASDDFQF